MIRRHVLILFLFCVLSVTSACETTQAGQDSAKFIIQNDAGFADFHVTRVIKELNVGVETLTKLGVPLRVEKFPITIQLKRGRGISRSYHGRGPIVLHRIAGRRSPIIHEVTHVLAGYTRASGHWTTEGFASYMQDKYGEDIAYPTRRQPNALMRVILDENAALPMIDVMRDRRRQNFFGKRSLWDRFLAYAQSSSFVKYLIDTYGIKKFLAIYDIPFEEQNFESVYAKAAPSLVTEWQNHILTQDLDTTRARKIYRNIRNFTR